jgi:hypothetical protein
MWSKDGEQLNFTITGGDTGPDGGGQATSHLDRVVSGSQAHVGWCRLERLDL